MRRGVIRLTRFRLQHGDPLEQGAQLLAPVSAREVDRARPGCVRPPAEPRPDDHCAVNLFLGRFTLGAHRLRFFLALLGPEGRKPNKKVEVISIRCAHSETSLLALLTS